MPQFVPDTLARWTGGRWSGPAPAALTDFSFDTRSLQAGEVFVALKTERRDGHDFLDEARRAGAAAALVARAVSGVILPQLVVKDPLLAFQAIAREHRRSFRGRVVGVSGSAGKTSTKDLMAQLLGGPAAGVVATEGNLNNHLGVPLTLTRIDPERTTFAVIEAGISAPGEMKALAGMIEPDVAIVTLIAPAHTLELGGLDGVAREKAVLPAAVRDGGVALFNADTAAYPAFKDLARPALVLERVASSAVPPTGPQRLPYAVAHQGAETRITLFPAEGKSVSFQLRRVSDGMADNAALALAGALRLGVTPAQAQSRLREWSPAKMRGEIRQAEGRLLYLDCYNANPASMADALSAFGQIASADQPRLYVIGCMEELGAEAVAHHRALGRTLKLRSEDQAYVIGTWAGEVRAGYAAAGGVDSRLRVVTDIGPMAEALAVWKGAIFVKGSRRYQLERVLGTEALHPQPC